MNLFSNIKKGTVIGLAIATVNTSIAFAADNSNAGASISNISTISSNESLNDILSLSENNLIEAIDNNKNKIQLENGEIIPAYDIANSSETIYAVVTSATGLNLRKDSSASSDIIKTLPSGYALSVIDVVDGWIKVTDDSNTTGFISSEYVSINKGTKPVNTASSKGNEVVSFAKQFLGTPYVYGGTNLKSGVDCSGFVYAVYKNFGISLNRSSRDQIKNGPSISKSELQAGDLVFFNAGGNSPISHVGIYMGNGQYIHSTDGKAMGVTITNLNSGYSARTYYGACRVLK